MEEDREMCDHTSLLIRTNGTGAGIGSGFFVEEDLIATNIHVIAGATSISIELFGTTNTKFDIVGVTAFDPKNDLVTLKVTGKGTPLPIGDSDLTQPGDVAQTVGYPRGKYKVTAGTVHSIRNSDKWMRMEFKAIGGNSGGPVLNANGEVVGVAVANADYFTFAIPANALKTLLTETREIESLAQWQERKQIRAYACLVQSQAKHFKSRHDEAIADLDKAIQLNPNCVFFYYNRGSVKSYLGKLKTDESDLVKAQQHCQDAINDYTEVIKLCPDYASAYINRGGTKSNLGQFKAAEGNFAEAQQHHQDAIDDYTEAIKLCPAFAAAYNNLANAKLLLGISEVRLENFEIAEDIWKEAVIDSDTSIGLDPNIAVFHHTRGQITVARGDFSAAIPYYERAIEIDPNYTDAHEELERVKYALEQQKIL